MDGPTEHRKRDHLEICADGEVTFRRKTPLFDDVDLVHEALPDMSFDDVDTGAEILGRSCRAPILISAMSGGIPAAERMNRDLAEAARELGLGLGLGSLRPLLEGGKGWPSLRAGKDDGLLLLANLGMAQVRGAPVQVLADLVGRVEADALCVHLNPAQEWFQSEGDRDFRGSLETLERLSRDLPVPLVVKETGCGVSAATASRLAGAGVRHLDVAGAGGTSWVAVEQERGAARSPWATEYRDWGIPTAASVCAASAGGFDTLIASGGVRSGLDAAKALALGAHAAGFALPVLQAWSRGGRAGVKAFLGDVLESFRTALALTGSRTPAELRGKYVVSGPALRAWIEGLGG